MPLNQRINKENVAHLHNGALLLSGIKKMNDTLKFVCNSMELEKDILSEVTHTQKDEHGMYSL